MKEYESFKCNTHKKMNANKSVKGSGGLETPKTISILNNDNNYKIIKK